MSVTYLTTLPAELQFHIYVFVPGSPERYRVLHQRVAKKVATIARGRSFGYCAECGEPHTKAETCGQYYNKLFAIRECATWGLLDYDQNSSIFTALVQRRHVDLVFSDMREDMEACHPNFITGIYDYRCEMTIRPIDDNQGVLQCLGDSEKALNIGDLKEFVVEIFSPPGKYH